MEVDLSRIEVRRWWGERRYVDIEHVSHGTVAAVQDPRRPGIHVPCIWMVAEQVEPGGLGGAEAAGVGWQPLPGPIFLLLNPTRIVR